MKKLFRLLLVSVLFGTSLTVSAATFPGGLNTALVPAAGQSTAGLHNAFVSGFLQVLIKITGNSQIGALPDIQQQLPQVERYVQKYRYLGNNIQVAFDEHALLTLLAQLQQPLWLSARPPTLIWLSVANSPPVNAGQTTDSNLITLQNAANVRAIPVTFPQMDADDQAVWQEKNQGGTFNQETLQKIADRYHVPAILYGEMTQQPDQTWNANWFLSWGGQTWQWQNNSAQPETILSGAVTKVADVMGQALAVNFDQQNAGHFWLVVMGVDNLSDYKAVVNELKRSESVLGVSVSEVGSHGLLLQLTTMSGDQEALKKMLDANAHFTAIQLNDGSDVLHYQWAVVRTGA
ncbi:MAG: DUF2066 domain-containing protein [Proteobacteria bacterium]|nr:DUF2066 domain-containing protein [Pseudomonadota bacterium]